MSSWFDGLERIQKELEQAQEDARQQFFDSFRQYRQSFLPEPSLFPSDFSTRSPAYQCAWIECQIEAHERKIAEIEGSSKQPPDSLIAAGAALINRIAAH